MFKNPFKAPKKGNEELIGKIMKKIEEEHFKKHGSLDGLNENEVLAMARSYMAYELGMPTWRDWLKALFHRSVEGEYFKKWETVFGNLIKDIHPNGAYEKENSDYIEHLRLVWKIAQERDLSDDQKTQAVMAFAISLRILDFNHIYDNFQKESPIFQDEKYRDMFEDFQRIGRF